jgi:hypothetical protein
MKIFVDELPLNPEYDCLFYNHLDPRFDCIMVDCHCDGSCPLMVLQDQNEE